MRPKYSIIIATWNALEETVKCIDSVYRFTNNFELVIVENGSTDGTAAWLKDLQTKKDNLKVIYNETNRNFGPGNNQGIAVAQGEFLIFLSDDCIVTENWAERLYGHFVNNDQVKNIGMIGPVGNNSNGRQMVGIQDPSAWYEKHKSTWLLAGRLYGWCMFTKKSVIDQIGGFDEQFENAYEDNDLSLRIQLAGYKLVIAYDTYVFHKGQSSLSKIYNKEQYIKSGHKQRKKYFDKWWDLNPRKLAAIYRTAGGKYLEQSLERTSMFADHIIIHFCRAPAIFLVPEEVNETGVLERKYYIEYLQTKFPKICKIQFYDGRFQEDYERNWLLQEALKLQTEGKADWCISVDDDELYEEKFVERAQKFMHPRNPEVFAYAYNWRTIWDKIDGKEYFRADGIFGNFINCRFFRLMPGQEIVSDHPEGHHSGSSPRLPQENLTWANFRVKHLGYETREQRKQKFQFYQTNDHFKTARDIGNEDYSHLVDIDVKLLEYKEHNQISLVCMTRNEEDYIQGMFENIEPLVDEIVIVDTGSTDRTIEIINEFAERSLVPVKLFHREWEDNYSIPRNFAKSMATKEWILMMDADERLDHHMFPKLRDMTESGADGVIFNVRNYLKETAADEDPIFLPTQAVRLFRNVPEFYWTGIIHETIDDSLSVADLRHRLNIYEAPAILHHFGFLKNKKKVRQKLDYYVGLNERQIEVTEGKDPRPFFNLALHYMEDDNKIEAMKSLQQAIKLNPRFWNANQEMAAININAAKEFMHQTLETMPETNPYRKKLMEIVAYLDQNVRGYIKVGV